MGVQYKEVDGEYIKVNVHRNMTDKEVFLERRTRSKWQRRIPTLQDTFRELRKICGKTWDNIDCICSAIGRDMCDLKCESYEE